MYYFLKMFFIVLENEIFFIPVDPVSLVRYFELKSSSA